MTLLILNGCKDAKQSSPEASGDFNYFGVKVDAQLHAEILERYAKLNLAPYTGFVNPMLIPVYDTNGGITDITVEYLNDYLSQMMNYGKNYSFLPVKNK